MITSGSFIIPLSVAGGCCVLGALYGNHWAISLETQRAADTPNHPNFTSAEVTPARPLHEVTEYRFSTLK